MNWMSPTTAVSTVVGSSHSTRTFRCTHWAMFRGPSHPAAPVKALAHGSPLTMRAPWSPKWTTRRTACLVALRDAGRRNRAVSFAPSCRELRPPKSGGRVMFGRCQTCLDHRSEPISGAQW
jgi:hypothetical protein